MKSKILSTGSILVFIMLMTLISCKSSKTATDQDSMEEQVENGEAQRQAEAEERARREREESERKAVEAEEQAQREKKNMVSNQLSRIYNASSESTAQSAIDEMLNMFVSNDVPVLVIIYENKDENVVDYDEPTTIGKYLEYLKIMNSKPGMVEEVQYNDAGKITELVLKKNF